ncbi:MAG: ATP-binding protein [Planctomycetota bacterium]|jgi:PAS domain S-box-containing protein
MKQGPEKNRRILVIDDNESIHKDFREILEVAQADTAALDEAKAAIFGAETQASPQQEGFEMDSAFQGAEGLEMVKNALAEGRPYAMAFVDMRMPPGWDGIETIQKIWAEYPQIQIVICTAYSDYQWAEIVDKLGLTDQLLILKKPFDNVEVRQLACSLTEKWSLTQQMQQKRKNLEIAVAERTAELTTANEELLHISKAVESSSDAIGMSDPGGKHFYQNNAFDELFGYDVAELREEAPSLLYADKDVAHQVFESIMAGKSWSGEVQMKTKNGRKITVLLRADAVKDKSGEVIGLIGIHTDITDRKHTEEVIEHNERFLEDVLNSIQDGICVLDPEFNIVRVNDAMRMWYSHALPLEGKKCYNVYQGMSQPCEICPAHRAFETGKIAMEESPLTQPEGVTGTLEVHAFPILDDGGKATGVVEYFRDITDRKHAEEELREQDRQKSDFVINVSHELRTPLTIFKNIISNALAGVMGQLNDKQQENFQIADREVDRLARIIGEFLDIAKIESGKMGIKRKQLDILTVATNVTKLLLPLAKSKNVELEIENPDNEELFVNADCDRMTQVMTNLVDNAIKFTPDCGGHITVRLRKFDTEIGVEVEDNGPGIEGDDINRVFNRFVQVERHVGPGSHGTGLGLAICKELIELQQGRIWVENVPTGGAKFCFVLPKYGFVSQDQLETDQNPAQPAISIA